MPRVIDVHHHIIPPQFADLWNISSKRAPGLELPPWSLDGTVNLLEQTSITAAILSLAHPIHPYVDKVDKVAPVCRDINRYIAQQRDAHPDKLGFFATLPPLDQTEVCVEEIRYAATELKADGFIIFSSYSGLYLGHPKFRDTWKELHNHKAVVLIHPGFEGIIPIQAPRVLQAPIVDWTHETTRTAIHMITENILQEFSDCRIILSHAGGTLPFVAQRAARLATRLGLWDQAEDEFVRQAQRFYVDVAFSGHVPQLKLLREFFPPFHVLFGSDYPFEVHSMISTQARTTIDVLGDEAMQGALSLFPRFISSD